MYINHKRPSTPLLREHTNRPAAPQPQEFEIVTFPGMPRNQEPPHTRTPLLLALEGSRFRRFCRTHISHQSNTVYKCALDTHSDPAWITQRHKGYPPLSPCTTPDEQTRATPLTPTSVITCAGSFLDWMPRYHFRRLMWGTAVDAGPGGGTGLTTLRGDDPGSTPYWICPSNRKPQHEMRGDEMQNEVRGCSVAVQNIGASPVAVSFPPASTWRSPENSFEIFCDKLEVHRHYGSCRLSQTCRN